MYKKKMIIKRHIGNSVLENRRTVNFVLVGSRLMTAFRFHNYILFPYGIHFIVQGKAFGINCTEFPSPVPTQIGRSHYEVSEGKSQEELARRKDEAASVISPL
jgi:hypothetical protein